MINTTLHLINLSDTVYQCGRYKAILGIPTYEAFTALLRVNTSLDLLPPFDITGADARLLECHDQLRTEKRPHHMTREEWVDALHKLSSDVSDDPSPSETVPLLRLQAAVCLS
jgi:hypothetical protein